MSSPLKSIYPPILPLNSDVAPSPLEAGDTINNIQIVGDVVCKCPWETDAAVDSPFIRNLSISGKALAVVLSDNKIMPPLRRPVTITTYLPNLRLNFDPHDVSIDPNGAIHLTKYIPTSVVRPAGGGGGSDSFVPASDSFHDLWSI